MHKGKAWCFILVLTLVLSLMATVPRQVLAQTQEGIQLYGTWDFQGAEKALRAALKANPQDVQASYFLGLSLLQQEKHEEALALFLKVKDAQDKAVGKARSPLPDAYQIQIALARAHLELKKLPEAWKNLEAAKAAHADTAELHVFSGAYYIQKPDIHKAIQELEKAMAMDAKDAYAHYYAGHAYLRDGNPQRAVELFKEFLQLAPLAPEAYKTKALIDALC